MSALTFASIGAASLPSSAASSARSTPSAERLAVVIRRLASIVTTPFERLPTIDSRYAFMPRTRS